MIDFETLLNAHERVYGTAKRNTLEKMNAMVLINDAAECPYCGCDLLCGPESAFDHTNGNGAEWRRKLNTDNSRSEIAMIISAKGHPEIADRKFICQTCNTVKKDMTFAEWIASPQYAWRIAQRRK